MNVGMCVTLITIDCIVKCFICHINYFGEITLTLLLLSMHILWPFVHHSKLVLNLLAVLILSWHVLFLSELWIEFCWWMWPILILGLFIVWNRLDTMLVWLIALSYIITPSYLRSEIVTLLVFASLFCLLNIWGFRGKQIAWWHMVLTWNSCHIAFLHLTDFLHDSCSSQASGCLWSTLIIQLWCNLSLLSLHLFCFPCGTLSILVYLLIKEWCHNVCTSIQILVSVVAFESRIIIWSFAFSKLHI